MVRCGRWQTAYWWRWCCETIDWRVQLQQQLQVDTMGFNAWQTLQKFARREVCFSCVTCALSHSSFPFLPAPLCSAPSSNSLASRDERMMKDAANSFSTSVHISAKRIESVCFNEYLFGSCSAVLIRVDVLHDLLRWTAAPFLLLAF